MLCAPSSSLSDRKTLFAFPVLRSINTTKMKQVSDSDLKLNRAHTYGRLRISRASVVAWPAALIVIGGTALPACKHARSLEVQPHALDFSYRSIEMF